MARITKQQVDGAVAKARARASQRTPTRPIPQVNKTISTSLRKNVPVGMTRDGTAFRVPPRSKGKNIPVGKKNTGRYRAKHRSRMATIRAAAAKRMNRG